MERLYPNPKTFANNSEPDLDAEYFNGVENGLSAVDERLANLLVSSLTATVAGQKALDAVVGRILDERITANAEAIAKTNSNLNTKLFNSLSQIGITPGTETSLAQIANAMPKNSTLSFDIANAKNTLYPKNWGEATFERIGTRTRIIFTTQNVSSATKQVYFYTNYVVGNTEAGWFIQTMSAVQ